MLSYNNVAPNDIIQLKKFIKGKAMKILTSTKTMMIFLFSLITCFLIFSNTNIFGNKLIDETTLITDTTLKFVTPPSDFRAYFLLQSIDDTTVILVGNFVDPEKVITLIIDEGSDNTIDSVVEYYPETKKFRRTKKLTSKFIKSDIAELKKDIIEGTVFEKNYSYQMSSLNTLKKQLEKGKDIFFTDAGTRVVINDPEKSATAMSDFFFKIKVDRYDLKFKTLYYKLYNTIIQPPISFSVYCRNSKDPVVAKYVKELLPLVSR
jgi:hypothetical protein